MPAKTPKAAPPAQARGLFPIVGIGASAGGLEAFTELLKALPSDTGMGFVLVQHLDPLHDSALTQILARATSMPVREATSKLPVQPNHIYIIPPNKNLAIAHGVLKLQPRLKTGGAARAIDYFFQSLADDQHERAIGVILSGTASDGTLGLEAIQAQDGITFAQDKSAKYDSMPRSAIAAGCVDMVLSPQGIALELARIAKHPRLAKEAAPSSAVPQAKAARDKNQPTGSAKALATGAQKTPRTGAKTVHGKESEAPGNAEENAFRKILLLLRNHCGVDFSLYRSSTIQRRVTRRMVLNKPDTLAAYAAFLRGNRDELDMLYSDVLISVTSFFRNPDAFEVLKRKVFPSLIRDRGDAPMRIWTLGCSTGQEAYSLAMAYLEFAEHAVHAPKLQVFATDLNDAVLSKARQGLYAKSLVDNISPERLRRFFVEEDGGYRVTKRLREAVIFARQNMLSDTPFSRMDLISCRNVLIYLEPELQKQVMPIFHYALKPKGVLFLGAAESVGGFTDLFESLDRKQKIFSKKAAVVRPLHMTPSYPAEKKSRSGAQPVRAPERLSTELSAQREADRVAINRFAPPGVLINAELQILQFSGDTGLYLKTPSGKASFDVLKMARADLMIPLRAAINKAKKDDQTVRKDRIRFDRAGHTVSIEVIPLKNLKERCYWIWFEEAGKPVHPDSPGAAKEAKQGGDRAQAQGSKRAQARIAELEHQLAETRDYLQLLQEQSEAAHEELQSSSEEMQSANEELQSLNEELETSKEELESGNEELTTVNDEMAHRNEELNHLSSDLANLMASVNMAILLLGRDLTIRRFTPLTEKIFSLLATDVGRPLSSIRHNLDCPDLEPFLAEVIATVSEREREVQDQRGHWYALRARPYRSLDNKIDGVVLVLVDIDALKRSAEDIQQAREYAEATLRTAPAPLIVLRANQRVNTANEAFYKAFKLTPAETEGRSIYEINNGAWDIPKLHELLEDILPRNSFFNDFEITHNFPGIGQRTLLLNARRLDSADDEAAPGIVLGVEDITARMTAQADLHHSETRYRRLFEAARDGILIVDPDSRKIIDVNPYMTDLLGYAHEEFLGKELWVLGLASDKEANQAAFAQLQNTSYIQYEDLPLETKDGVCCEVEFVSNLYRENGRHVIQCNIRDISARKKLEDALRHSAAHDALTGLPNKALFLELVNTAVGRATRRPDYLFAVLFVDLDRFKIINDSLGHLVGDQLLADVAKRLNTGLRSGDILARFGGDEFTILMDDVKDADEVVEITERIQKGLSLPFIINGETVHTTASIGITLSTPGHNSAEDIVRDADMAMYRAKALGRAGYELFDKGMRNYAFKLWELEGDLRRAIEHQELFICYQPVVCLNTGKIISLEALARWQHPSHGVLDPQDFIPLAEETGLIKIIGENLLRSACMQIKAWQSAGHPALKIAVNCSALQFQDKNLPAIIRAVLAETGVSPTSLILEITESVAMKHVELSMAMLDELTAMGVHIAIDDFGTGYSSLSCLKRFSIAMLKIDQSFVKDMTSDDHDAAISAAIISMAHSLKLKVIAEGVETEEQLAMLRFLKCDQIQGYLFSKPLMTDNVKEVLDKEAVMVKEFLKLGGGGVKTTFLKRSKADV